MGHFKGETQVTLDTAAVSAACFLPPGASFFLYTFSLALFV